MEVIIYLDVSLKTLQYFFVPLFILIPVKMIAGTGGPNDELELILICISICLLLLAVYYTVGFFKKLFQLMHNNLHPPQINITEDSPDDHPLDESENPVVKPVL